MRFIGMDVDRDFCGEAIHENGSTRSVGQVPTETASQTLLAESLGPEDRVALKATGNAHRIAGILEPHVARMLIVDPQLRRLMTIADVDMVTAVTLMSCIGDVRRFPTQRNMVGYVGLDPRVRQSGVSAARHGHISRQGSATTPARRTTPPNGPANAPKPSPSKPATATTPPTGPGTPRPAGAQAHPRLPAELLDCFAPDMVDETGPWPSNQGRSYEDRLPRQVGHHRCGCRGLLRECWRECGVRRLQPVPFFTSLRMGF